MSDGNHDPTAKNAEGGTDGVPTFTLDELNRCRGQILRGGALGKVYAINGFPGLAVKDVYLTGQQTEQEKAVKFELEVMSRFSHPGVLKYHQVVRCGIFFHIVMDRYDEDLDNFITKQRDTFKSIPRELMLSIVKQLADALAYFHSFYTKDANGKSYQGIIHRDLKPANILMSEDGSKVVLAGFGLCKYAQDDRYPFEGTLLYMAPEIFIRQETSCASDVWALGVIIYELATLRLPSFSRHWYPEDAKKCFVDGWRPDLSAVEDAFIRGILEKIFVLDLKERLTAKQLAGMITAAGA
ncbi:Ankyrin repeat protein [Giardia duodenalis]|uniref:non-specific serine/threonine protein kinase n=1 Tax=Giardia intestinalis TaxID=5741 RepID=V6U2F6_GIAIN|nr:Ankyrin repeat protein [Giardia intestinalis]